MSKVIRSRTMDRVMTFKQSSSFDSALSVLSHIENVNKLELQPVNSQEFPNMNIDQLCVLATEESYTMPRGLTREQRRQWAKSNLNQNSK